MDKVKDATVYHAGTRMDEDGRVVTNGGRVLSVTSFGSDFRQALSRSYDDVSRIHFEDCYYRKDIGFDL